MLKWFVCSLEQFCLFACASGIAEPDLPAFPSLQAQWSKRQIWIISSELDDDRLVSQFWLPSLTLEEEEDSSEDKVPHMSLNSNLSNNLA